MYALGQTDGVVCADVQVLLSTLMLLYAGMYEFKGDKADVDEEERRHEDAKRTTTSMTDATELQTGQPIKGFPRIIT